MTNSLITLSVIENILTSGYILQISASVVGILIASLYWRKNGENHSPKTVLLSFILGYTITYGLTGFLLSIIAPTLFQQHPYSSIIIKVGSAVTAFYGFQSATELIHNGSLEDFI